MKRTMKMVMTTCFVVAVLFISLGAVQPAQAQGTVVYDSMPTPTPPNVPSQGFQCCSVSEAGDEIKLEADTPRQAGFATVLMSSWSLHSNYPDMPAEGYIHPITLNIYTDSASALAHTPVKTITQDFLIPWRPEADPACGTAWLSTTNGACYNGFAFKIKFDLQSLNYELPEQFIYGIAYNTNTWGYEPIGQPGPYESLNVGFNTISAVAVGTDVNSDAVYVNYKHGPFYTDGGASGIGTFRPDTNWTGYIPAVQFTTIALPTDTASCKNGAWQNLVRRDLTPFKNQGACVSYVNTGK